MPTEWDIDWSAVDWPSAGAWVLAAVVVLTVLYGLISSGTRALVKGAKGAKGNGPVILAGLVALLASGMSIQAQWGFLGHNLEIDDDLTKASFVGVFDLAAIAAALLSREARVRRPGTFGADALIVWAVALLLGWLGSTEATTTEGEAARWAVPLVAALMWDRVIQRDVARAVSLDRARMATVTGRITAAVVRVGRALGRSIMRTLARVGLVQPDQDIAQIQHARWRRRFITAASRAAAARRRHDAAPTDTKAGKRRDRADERFAAVVAAGQRLGAITSPEDLSRLLWDAQVVLNAADALVEADADSPWRTAGSTTAPHPVPVPTAVPVPARDVPVVVPARVPVSLPIVPARPVPVSPVPVPSPPIPPRDVPPVVPVPAPTSLPIVPSVPASRPAPSRDIPVPVPPVVPVEDPAPVPAAPRPRRDVPPVRDDHPAGTPTPADVAKVKRRAAAALDKPETVPYSALDAEAKKARRKAMAAAVASIGQPGSNWRSQRVVARHFAISTTTLSRIVPELLAEAAELTKVNGS